MAPFAPLFLAGFVPSAWRLKIEPRFGHSMVMDPYTNDLLIYGGFTKAPDWDTPAPRIATSYTMLLYNVEPASAAVGSLHPRGPSTSRR
eukprot:984841-Prorocentrum_minimum.AAC.1